MNYDNRSMSELKGSGIVFFYYIKTCAGRPVWPHSDT